MRGEGKDGLDSGATGDRETDTSRLLAIVRNHFAFKHLTELSIDSFAWSIEAERRDLSAEALQFSLVEKFDVRSRSEATLVVALGIADRIPRDQSAAFVGTVCRLGPAVLFSSAIPGQGGAGIVNEAWPEEWARLFAEQGYDCYDVLRPEIFGREDVDPDLQQNALLFVSSTWAVESWDVARRQSPATYVHRVTYDRALRRIGQMRRELQAVKVGNISVVKTAASASEYYFGAQRYAPASVVIEKLVSAVKGNLPLSLIRVGHCETKFLNWPDVYTRDEIDKSFRRQFGYIDLSEGDVSDIGLMMRSAISASDVLGIPILSEADWKLAEIDNNMRLWSTVSTACEKFRLVRSDAVVTSPNIHNWLVESDFLDVLLKVTHAVTLVGCRDLRPHFRRLGFTDVEYIAVPEAYRTRDRSALVERHYPHAFSSIMREIRDRRRPGLHLVGAGILGKIYCREIRLAGGVAVDVGAVMDVWAGIVSRTGWERRVETYALSR
ncbi:MAG: hypothetical protein U1E62_22490 [Alsobacter sp.]